MLNNIISKAIHPQTYINKFRLLPRSLILILLAISLTACGGGGGGGSGGSSSSIDNSILGQATEQLNSFGITDLAVIPSPSNFSLSWVNPVNPTQEITSYLVTALAYTDETAMSVIDGASGSLTNTTSYTSNNASQTYNFGSLTTDRYYEFFITANYIDATTSAEIRLFRGRLLAGLNTDGDGLADGQDLDDDNDGVNDFDDDGTVLDNCQFVVNPSQLNNDEDATGDICDADDDNDGVNDFNSDGTALDNCQFVANPAPQTDTDGDESGNACDADDDGDNIADIIDTAPLDNTIAGDHDEDSVDSVDDVDDDGDGLIEIYTATALNAVRYNLAGTGLDLTDDSDNQAGGDSTGCPASECTGYELMSNLTLTSYSSWQPIGSCNDVNCNGDELFGGTFTGNGYTISDMSINTDASLFGVGLFGATAESAIIHNLHINNVNISAPNSRLVGSLVGWASGLINATRVEARSILARDNVGGLVGVLFGNQQILSSVVLVERINGFAPVGGLVANVGTDARVTSSIAVINTINQEINAITSPSEEQFGVGGLAGNSNGIITSSAVIVHTIREIARSTGGLVGSVSAISNTIDATSIATLAVTHNISSPASVGGLYGEGTASAADYSLALTNFLNSQSILSGRISVGGLFGLSGTDVGISFNPHRVTDSYWDDGVTYPNAQPEATAPGVGHSTSDLQTGNGDIYANWGGSSAGWCDPTTGTYSDNTTAPTGYQAVWDLGTDSEYPALNCLPLSTAEQRRLIDLVLGDEFPIATTFTD